MSSVAQLPLALDRLPPPSLDNFRPGPNARVVAALRDALAPPHGAWLAISGASGTGKTHLLSAAVAAASGMGRRSLMVNGRRLSREAAPDALRGFQDSQLLCVDDLEGLLGDAVWEEALFHLLNELRSGRATLVFATARPTAGLRVGLPDLASRLATATRLRLQPLGEGDKKALLLARAEEAGVRIAPEALDLLFKRVPRDLPGLVHWLDQMCAASLAEGRRLSRRFVAEKVRQAASSPGSGD